MSLESKKRLPNFFSEFTAKKSCSLKISLLNVNKFAFFVDLCKLIDKTLTESFSLLCSAKDATPIVTVIYKTSSLYRKFEEQYKEYFSFDKLTIEGKHLLENPCPLHLMNFFLQMMTA